MKQFNAALLALGFFATAQPLLAQTTSTFEENTLPDSSYYDGSDYSWGFNSGNAHFYNYYDTTFGAAFGYWAQGWVYSNKVDTVTQTSNYGTQLYCARETSGYASSENFAMGTQDSRIVLTGAAEGRIVGGVYITNNTYAYNSMKLGDMFGKKFGGASGNDPDYFKLVIKKYLGGTLGTDSVEFYLADFRFADNTQDYLVKEWTWVDLTSLGNVDSLQFSLRSSDVGGFGINTPLYYCIDNLVTLNAGVGVNENTGEILLNVFPNPCNNVLNIYTGTVKSVYSMTDMQGKTICAGHFDQATKVDVAVLPAGVYALLVNGKTVKFVKQQ